MRCMIPVAVFLLLAGCSTAESNPGERQPTCAEEVGRPQATVYAEHCRLVSPATHPPCNILNACSLITGEIKRGCLFIAEGVSSGGAKPRISARCTSEGRSGDRRAQPHAGMFQPPMRV